LDIKINNKFQFSDDTYGLPDHFFKDELGNVSSVVFRQLLGMDRRKFKAATKQIDKSKKYAKIGQLKKEPLIDLYSTQDFRRENFRINLKFYFDRLADNSSKGICQIMAKYSAPSIELIILDEYARDIFIDSELYKEKKGKNKSGLGKFIKHGEKNKVNVSHIKLPEGIRDILASIKTRFEDQINNWDTLLETERKQLSEIAWALSTIHAPDIFNICLKEYDGFSEYFKWIIELPANNEKVKKTENFLKNETSSELLDSEKGYCEKIILEAQKGLDSNSD